VQLTLSTTLHLLYLSSYIRKKGDKNCQILGVLRSPKTQVSDYGHHWVHQLANDAVIGYTLGARCCNLDEIQLSPLCMVE
jgi:hypothetical protein